MAELADIRAHEFGSQAVLSEVVKLKVAASYLKVMIDKMPEALAAWEGVEENSNRFDHLRQVIAISHGLIGSATTAPHALLADESLGQS